MMKVYVYAIAKNEEKFVGRFMDAVRDADGVFVLDTGSSDGTVKALRERGAVVRQVFLKPFRFDVARNLALKLLPDEDAVCVWLDLDEVISSGWRERLLEVWNPETGVVRFTTVRNRNGDSSAGCSFLVPRAHVRHGFRWRYPVHEVLERVQADGDDAPAVVWDLPDVLVEHLPDPDKSRAQYLDLLELGVRENPDDPRMRHYLGREYMYRGRWDDAIRTLQEYLDLPAAVWTVERSDAMRFLSKCFLGKHDMDAALFWAKHAILEEPERRETWYAAEECSYYAGDWRGVAHYGRFALRCKKSPQGVNDAEAWGAAPYDLFSLACFRLGRRPEASEAAEQAHRLAPWDDRIKYNYIFLRNALKKEGKIYATG